MLENSTYVKAGADTTYQFVTRDDGDVNVTRYFQTRVVTKTEAIRMAGALVNKGWHINDPYLMKGSKS